MTMNTTETYLDRKISKKTKITDIKPFQKRINLIFKVIKKGYVRKIQKTILLSVNV